MKTMSFIIYLVFSSIREFIRGLYKNGIREYTVIVMFVSKTKNMIEFIFGTGQENYGKDPVKTGILIAKKALKDIESKINGKIDKRKICLVVVSHSKIVNIEKYNLWNFVKGVKEEARVSLSKIVTTTEGEIIDGKVNDDSVACIIIYSDKPSIGLGLTRVIELDITFCQWLYRWITKGFKAF